jgi:glucosamine-phosphate N-acetyltransferase
MARAYCIRPLEASDYNREYLTLLGELGAVPEFDVEAYPGRIFVAVFGGEHIVATASCFLEPKCTHGGALVAHVEDVVTAAAHRRKGLATELLREIRAFATERGCRKIILNCSEHYVGFYANAGFSRAGALMRMDL